MRTVLSLLFLSVLANALLIRLLITRQRILRHLKRIYDTLHGNTGMDNLITLMTQDIEKNFNLVDVLFKNRRTRRLEGKKVLLSALATSAPVQAFYSLTPMHDVHRGSNSTSDQPYPIDVSYVPFHILRKDACWQNQNCNDRDCPCYGKDKPRCWIESEKRHRGTDLSTYQAGRD